MPYAIRPKDGYLDKSHKVALTISGVRDVVIELEVNAPSQSNASIAVACHVTRDTGEGVPLTLANVDRICRQITRQGQQAAAVVNAMQAEGNRLQAWIDAPIVKPVLERNRARARVMELGILINEQSALVQSFRGELEMAERVKALTTHLHDDCLIELAVAE